MSKMLLIIHKIIVTGGGK